MKMMVIRSWCTITIICSVAIVVLNYSALLRVHGFGQSFYYQHKFLSTTRSTAHPRSSLTMHMGHSHNHHHHDKSSSSTTTISNNGSNKSKVLLLLGRRPIRIVFAGLITLLPPIIKRTSRGITKSDMGAFLLLSSILAIFDSVRDEMKAAIAKGESWRISWLKHSTPLSAAKFLTASGDRVTLLGIIINVLLSGGKFLVGMKCHSSALIADAGHSLSDLFSDFVTLWAVQIARLPPDDDHPYGHGKFESVGSLLLSLTLLGTGLSVGISSYMKFIRVMHNTKLMGGGATAVAKLIVELPKWPALLMAGLSIVSKEWLFRVTRRVGEELNSQVIIANAWHHRSDAYSSVLALISIGLAMTVPGFLAADPAAGILVAGMIAMTGAEILGESVKQLTDATTATDEELLDNVKLRASDDADVRRVTRVRARQVGSSALVDVAVDVPPELSASAMRAIEERIRVRIVAEVFGVLDVEVKATGEDVVFCPLLTAIEDSDTEHHISATEVEFAARQILKNDPAVWFVRGVTVHYQDTVRVRVDANICVDPDISVAEAIVVAAKLKKNLEKSNEIDQASIYLDLNRETLLQVIEERGVFQ